METNVSSSQVVCWYCEEAVHKYATQCPYCQHNLTAPQQNAFEMQLQQASLFSLPQQKKHEDEKITQISDHPFQNSSPAIEQNRWPEQPEEITEAHAEALAPSTFSIIFSLVSLLAGSFFFFFGALLKLFAKNGTFSLSWNAEQWPYYVFPSLLLIVAGLYSLSKYEHNE